MNGIYLIIPAEESEGLVWDPLQDLTFYEAIGRNSIKSDWVAQKARFLDDAHEKLNAGVVRPGGSLQQRIWRMSFSKRFGLNASFSR